MLTYTTEIRVRFSETDKMQFVHNAKYIEYFELARTEMLRHYGLPYSAIEKTGYEMPVVETFIKYKNPAYYDEELIVESSVKELYSPRVHIEYKIFKKESMLLAAEGYTDLVFINSETKKASRPPAFYIDAFKDLFKVTV